MPGLGCVSWCLALVRFNMYIHFRPEKLVNKDSTWAVNKTTFILLCSPLNGHVLHLLFVATY